MATTMSRRVESALGTLVAIVVGFLAGVQPAHAQINVNKARIGCLDIQTDGNLTGLVAQACNGKWDCSYKAPTESQYKAAGVQAKTRSFCSQGMEITYLCAANDFHTVGVPGDAWNNPPAQLHCNPPQAAHVPKPDLITVSSARIGCLDIQKDPNLTPLVARACDDRKTCSYKAPTEQQYRAAGVQALTRSFCTQGMQISYQCGHNDFHTVDVPGDAWNHDAAVLDCSPPVTATGSSSHPDVINITGARIGCLDIQKTPNMTSLVAAACNDKKACSYKAPTEQQYKAAGVKAATRSFCTQGMEISYNCGHNDPQSAFVPGDAWNNPPAELLCNPAALPPNHVFTAGTGAIGVTKARIGCLDIQTDGNLTRFVQGVCNDRLECSYKAPTEAQYRAEGVQAKTRQFCTQGMEITYRCGQNDEQVVKVDGDAWVHPPAELICDGRTIATNRQSLTPPPQGTPTEPACTVPAVWTQDPAAATEYILAPSNMLDWTPTQSRGDYTFIGFRPPQPATRAMYRSAPVTGSPQGAPGSTLGANEGRVRSELREVAQARSPLGALCKAAQMYTHNKPAPNADTPSDLQFGDAFADLSVTGKHTFAEFVRLRPTAATLKTDRDCAGASDAGIARALDRAYQVADALRLPHDSPQRKGLHWIAVSGEDDQPYRPVNVPSTSYPQFEITVDLPKWNIRGIQTRYMLAHRTPPAFQRPAPLVDGGPGHQVPADVLPALAPDAQVLLFIHGMDSKLEEAEDLTKALHQLPDGKNWTVLSLDLASSGYTDNLDPGLISPAGAVACHHTPLIDFLEDFIITFVATLDRQLQGTLEPRIKAVVGGSLGGNMSMRLGRRTDVNWITHVVPWSPAAIWPSMIARPNCVSCGCDTGWDMLKDRAVNQSLDWAGKDPRFLPKNETPELRRELFYGGFDWAPVGGLGGPPQAMCWFSDNYRCKQALILGSRIDRQETYDKNFRAWHWELGAEQLAFSHQQFSPNTNQPLYLKNTKPMLLFTGYEDTCGGLGQYTRDVSEKMVNTPGYARFLNRTGHSLDNEHPDFIAREIAEFLK